MGKSLVTMASCVLGASLVISCTNHQSPGTGYYSNPNYSNTYQISSNTDVVGQSHQVKVREGETLSGIASRYDVGVQEMKDANPQVNYKKLTVGEKVNVPSSYVLPPKKYRNGIVINVAEMRLYYFSPDGRTVSTYPVALGRAQWRTPVANTTVVRKTENPVWRPPASIRKYAQEHEGITWPAEVPPGPDNPLGKYALYLGIPGYLIHGTNRPVSIGNYISSGCVRMYNEDVAELYRKVQPGTPVHIIHYPNKVGWRGNQLYLESHKPVSDATGAYAEHTISVDQAVQQATQGKNANVSQQRIREALNTHDGEPVVIGQGA